MANFLVLVRSVKTILTAEQNSEQHCKVTRNHTAVIMRIHISNEGELSSVQDTEDLVSALRSFQAKETEFRGMQQTSASPLVI